MESTFLKKVNEIIAANMGDSRFGVNELSREMGMSHTSLLRKVRLHTGKSVSKLIREFRLKKALELLQSEDLSVSEVAYRLGFSSHSYFDSCFKNYFGYPPGDVKNHHQSIVIPEHKKAADWLISRTDKLSKSLIIKPNVRTALLAVVGLAVLIIGLLVLRNLAKKDISIAVLPFDNVSPDPGQDYFADGLTAEVISDLARIDHLTVISIGSARIYKEKLSGAERPFREARVRYLLEGTVRKVKDEFRIIVRLKEASTNIVIWSEPFPGTLEDVFEIQRKVSESIVNELRLELSIDERVKLAKSPFANSLAYDNYLKARDEIYKLTESSINRAINYLSEALALEGPNSKLYAEMAHAYYQFWNLGLRFVESDLEMARFYVDKAFEQDKDSPDALFMQGMLQMTGGDIRKCIAYHEQVIERSPNHADAGVWLAAIYCWLGLEKEANRAQAYLTKVDPYYPYLKATPVILNLMTGKFEQADKLVRQLGSEELNQIVKTLVFSFNGRFEEADSVFMTLSERTKNTCYAKANLLLLKAFSNKIDDANQLIDSDLKLWASKDFQYSYMMAEAYSLLNQKEDALYWLENSVNHGFVNYPFIAYHDPSLKNIRDEEHFQKLLTRVKTEWEELKQ